MRGGSLRGGDPAAGSGGGGGQGFLSLPRLVSLGSLGGGGFLRRRRALNLAAAALAQLALTLELQLALAVLAVPLFPLAAARGAFLFLSLALAELVGAPLFFSVVVHLVPLGCPLGAAVQDLLLEPALLPLELCALRLQVGDLRAEPVHGVPLLGVLRALVLLRPCEFFP